MTGRSPRAPRPSRPSRPSPSPVRRPPGRRGPLLPAPRPPARAGPPAARSAAGPSLRRPPLRSFRSSPSPSSRRRLRLADPGARMTETSGARRGVPTTSIRPSRCSGERVGLAEISEMTSIPSRPVSISARRMAPVVSPSGTSAPSSTPLGCRAPAARQVHEPSAILLVNSISMRRDMRRTRYRASGLVKGRAGFGRCLGRSHIPYHGQASTMTADGRRQGCRRGGPVRSGGHR